MKVGSFVPNKLKPWHSVSYIRSLNYFISDFIIKIFTKRFLSDNNILKEETEDCIWRGKKSVRSVNRQKKTKDKKQQQTKLKVWKWCSAYLHPAEKKKTSPQPQTRQNQENDFSQRLMSAAENNIYKRNYIAFLPVFVLTFTRLGKKKKIKLEPEIWNLHESLVWAPVNLLHRVAVCQHDSISDFCL